VRRSFASLAPVDHGEESIQMTNKPPPDKEAPRPPKPGSRPSPKRGAFPSPKSEIDKARPFVPEQAEENKGPNDEGPAEVDKR
jgi:hypothetical protein